MSWRTAGTYTSIVLLVVALVSGMVWFVMWLQGYDEAAVYPMVIAFIAFVSAGTVLGLSRGPPGGTRVVTQDMVRRSGPPGSLPPPYAPNHSRPVHRSMPRSYLDDRPGEPDRLTEAMLDDIVDDMMAGRTPRAGESYTYTTVRPVQGPPVTREGGDRFDSFAHAVDEYSLHADEAMERRDRIKRRWGYK